jgi:hypothetical protein
VALLEEPGKVVTREELRSKLWPADTFVDFDHGLNAAIKRLRDALRHWLAEGIASLAMLRYPAPRHRPGPDGGSGCSLPGTLF